MKTASLHTKGFTLIASLLMLLLLSGIAIGLLMMVNTEGKVGGTDLQNNVAYHAAEGGIEKMATDLAFTFQNAQSPMASQICNIGLPNANGPALPGIQWIDYSAVAASTSTGSPCTGKPLGNWGQIKSGPNQDLWAQIIPVNLLATAASPGGQEVSMTRQAQVALIPVFQYGVFSESDLAFFSTPTLDFNGRVHTNGDLYLGVAGTYTLEFHHKIEAYGNVVTNNIPNTLKADSSANDTGPVYIPTADPGCNAVNPPTQNPSTDTQCKVIADNQGSVTGMGSSTAQTSTYNGSAWNAFSSSTNHQIINGNYGSTAYPGTGAKKLSMPFVGGNDQPYEIIRRPPAGENATSSIATSREYNMAQIHVLLSDDPADLPGGSGDADNVRLANITQAQAVVQGLPATAHTNDWGIPLAAAAYPAGLPALAAGNTYNQYFAAASNEVPGPAANCANTTCTADWPYAPRQWATNPNPTLQGLQPSPVAPTTLINAAPAAISLCPPASVNLGVYVPTSFTVPANCAPALYGTYPYYVPPSGPAPSNSASSTTWSLIDGYLRVEYKDKNGNWNPVTNEWLQLGFARDTTSPTKSWAGTPAVGIANDINPQAILLLQEAADRDGSGAPPNSKGTAPVCNSTIKVGSVTVCKTWTPGVPPEVAADTAALGAAGYWEFGVTATNPPVATPQSITQYNWYPINFYDAREGEPRDVTVNNDSCTTNGVMNAVEIDVGNLQQWLLGKIGTSGKSVDYIQQNGYVLYFSDRRGMLLNAHPPLGGAAAKTGDSGLEDVVNASSQSGKPDGVLETPGGTNSPEDVNQNGFLDNFGVANEGLGFWNDATHNLNTAINSPAHPDPFGTTAPSARITSCGTTGRKNWVSGARHVLKLVDGALANLPLSPNGGGFTVASENPVYIQGNYNSAAGDTFFTTPSNTAPAKDKPGYAPAAVIADAVTILSNAWSDQNSMMLTPTDPTNRTAAQDTYYRVAIAGGKNRAFPFPAWANENPDYPFATDGGVGNFLRLLEDWQGPGATLHYGGSLVSLYYATYNTGLFKCCTYSVYQPPTRNYFFDVDFTLPAGAGLPPGTPMFRDVESLSYRQFFTPRTN